MTFKIPDFICNITFQTVTPYFSHCLQAGLFIDKGVKTTNASAADPREYLCLDNTARYVPTVFIHSILHVFFFFF